MNCLNVALHVAGNLRHVGYTINCPQWVSSNADIEGGGGSNITGNAWAVGNINGSVSGIKDESEWPQRQMPQTTVWDYYLANGTPIAINSIPGNKIELAVLSAGNNPYGEENPQGIYVIDCANQALTICKSRIEATLVILNPAGGLVLDDVLCWDPPAANYPSLMVQGDLVMQWDGGIPLSESLGVNLNPDHSPYANATDGDMLDAYPGTIRGLVYVSGNLTTSSACMMDGVTIVGGAATFNSTTTFAYDAKPSQYPPPGFAAGAVMRVIPKSWRRAAAN
jgi:hypothetical protein